MTDRIVRRVCKEGDMSGVYNEYVPPLDPLLDKTTTRTLFMKLGSSLVLPLTSVVRFGAHPLYELQVFGLCVMAAFPNTADMRPVRYPDLIETDGTGTDFHSEEALEGSRVLHLEENFILSNNDGEHHYVVGTIPLSMNVTFNSDFRRGLLDRKQDIVPQATSLNDVYLKNPVVSLRAYDEDVLNSAEAGMRCCFVDDVQYADVERALPSNLSFPIDIEELLARWGAGGVASEESVRSDGTKSATAQEGGEKIGMDTNVKEVLE